MLIEVLIAVCVVGVLAAIAVPVIGQFRTGAVRNSASSAAVRVERAVRECAAEGGSLPGAFARTGPVQFYIFCGAAQSTLAIDDGTSVALSVDSSTQLFTVTATATDGSRYTVGNASGVSP